MRRIFKQAAYGIFLMILFGFFISLSIDLYPKATCFDGIQNQGEEDIDCGGPCISCELKDLEIAVETIRFFPAGDYRINLVAEIKNPSVNYAARLNYVIHIFNRFGLRVSATEGTTFILPAETKYLLAPAISAAYRDISSVKLIIRKTDWQTEESLRLPEITIENVKTTVDERHVEVVGQVYHRSSGTIRRLLVAALFFNDRGDLIHFSTTHLDNITSFSSRTFEIILPLQYFREKNINPRLTKVVVEIIL